MWVATINSAAYALCRSKNFLSITHKIVKAKRTQNIYKCNSCTYLSYKNMFEKILILLLQSPLHYFLSPNFDARTLHTLTVPAIFLAIERGRMVLAMSYTSSYEMLPLC